MDFVFNALLGAAATVEQPVDGQTGVWIKTGDTVVSSAMKMRGAVVSAGQTQYIYSRGVATGGTIIGSASVLTGGLLESSLLLSAGARLHIPDGGGSCNGLTISGNYNTFAQQYGGVVTNVVMKQGSYDMYTARAFASGIVVSSGANRFAVLAGSATDITAYGLVRTSNSGVINSVTAMKGGRLEAIKGVMSNVIVSSGGTLTVSSGGSALAVTSNTGATVTVLDGGYIEYE